MRKVVKNKKGDLDIPFGLIFAILAGTAILVFAIVAATKLKNIEITAQEGETSKTIGVLMNPLESSFEELKKVVIINSKRTRIYTSCEIKPNDIFGKQIIQTSQLTYGKWPEPELEVKFENKYMFSESPAEAKKFYVFSEPFEFPFKVGDLIYIVSSEKHYCFLNTPNDVEESLEFINLSNFHTSECPEESTNICFRTTTSQKCDIRVYYSEGSGYVLKEGERMYFQGEALMFAGIFSDSKTYECQIKRLINRTKILNEIYLNKESKMSQELLCGASIRGDLIVFDNFLDQYSTSQDLSALKVLSDDLSIENEYGGKCQLW